MRLEIKERGTKEYYDEFLYAVSRYRKFKKDPRIKTHQFTKYLIVCNIFVLFALLLNAYFYFDTNKTIFAFMTGALVVSYIIQVTYFVVIKKRLKMLLNTKGVRIIEFSASGIEYIDDDKNIRVKWDDIKYVVINKYTICIIPKIVINGFTSIDTKYKEEIIATLKKYNKLSLLIDNSDYYNR